MEMDLVVEVQLTISLDKLTEKGLAEGSPAAMPRLLRKMSCEAPSTVPAVAVEFDHGKETQSRRSHIWSAAKAKR